MRWSTALWTGIGSMPPLRRLPLVLLCLVLGMLAGCRGQRGPHMIDIQGITPSGTIGAEGGSVEFAAQVDSSSGQPLTYAWTFSGGVTPATSGEESPTVSLTTAGSFTGGLTVTDGQALALASFSYDIETGVIVITGVTPSDPAGKPAGTVTFAAEHTGTATEATWTFSGGTDVATSEELSPTVTLGEVGIYEGIVELRNENFTAVQPFSFRIDPPVAPSWRVMSLGPSLLNRPSFEIVGPRPDTFVWRGLPGLIMDRPDGVYLALALNEDPQSASDWQISRIAAGHTKAGITVTEGSLFLLSMGTSAASAGKGTYLSRTSVFPPTEEADWETTLVQAGEFEGGAVVALPDLGLLYSYVSRSNDPIYGSYKVVLSYCAGFAPSGPSSWTGYALTSHPYTADNVAQLRLDEDGLSLLFAGGHPFGPGFFLTRTETLPPPGRERLGAYHPNWRNRRSGSGFSPSTGGTLAAHHHPVQHATRRWEWGSGGMVLKSRSGARLSL
ncbi:MAG: hypothetical protein GEEBNDBF_01566 [bacterium]|nr:hypothetical protein [bacterium]